MISDRQKQIEERTKVDRSPNDRLVCAKLGKHTLVNFHRSFRQQQPLQEVLKEEPLRTDSYIWLSRDDMTSCATSDYEPRLLDISTSLFLPDSLPSSHQAFAQQISTPFLSS